MNTPKHVSVPSFPIWELMRRYAGVFRAAWAQRANLTGPQLLVDERAYLPAVMSLQETPPHPAPRRTAIAICILFACALLWSIFGQVDIVAVAQGRILVSQRSKQIQPLETSVVQKIYVKDGDKVKAGQILVELDATNSAADVNRLRQDQIAAKLEWLRTQGLLKSLETGGVPIMPVSADIPAEHLPAASTQLNSEWQDIRARLAKFDAELQQRRAEIATTEQMIKKLEVILPLTRSREKDFQSLTSEGFISSHASQDRMRERIEQERDLATTRARRTEALANLRSGEQARHAYIAETRRILNERLAQSELKARQLDEEAAKASKRKDLTHLSAPVAGTVQQLSIHTVGGVVTPAQVLMVLVPDSDEVTAEVVLENKDVGFLREGQAAEIKLETFPYTRYGTVPAQLRSISADAVNDEKRGAIFPATLVLKQTHLRVDGKLIKLSPGMNLSAEIKTGKRRVIDYLISPLQEHADESMKER